MSLRINHNTSSLNSLRNVIQNTNAQSKTMEKLSSGLKITNPFVTGAPNSSNIFFA